MELLPPGVDLKAAMERQLRDSPQLLPLDTSMQALAADTAGASRWIGDVLKGRHQPVIEETVAVSKSNHGVRPVALWDTPTLILYRALTILLEPALPPLNRGRAQWTAFRRAPLDIDGAYIVGADLTACYQYIDHRLLLDELLLQTGNHAVADTLGRLLPAVQGRAYGLPQQSTSSDLLAELILDRLERTMVRRGVQVGRYNDDFRFTCRSWSEAVRAIEVFADESRKLGFAMNDLKTFTWKRSTYQRSLDEADELRNRIASEANYDLTRVEFDPYGFVAIEQPPDLSDVDREAAARIVERWARVGGRSRVAASRAKEHRALLELLPSAIITLEADPATDPQVLRHLMLMLRFARQMTAAVGRYLASRIDVAPVITAFDHLLTSRAYLNGWQQWWLQQAIADRDEFAVGDGSARRIRWLQSSLDTQSTPTLRAFAAYTLARHRKIDTDRLLRLYDRTGVIARPNLVAAIAVTKPANSIRTAITKDHRLHRWVFDWAQANA